MGRWAFLVTIVVSLLAGELAWAAPDKLAVMPLKGRRVPQETVEILDELLVGAVDRAGKYQVISASDINAILGLERMKEAAGCDDLTCAADIGGALGVRYIIAGSVNRLGGELIVTLKLIDVGGQKVDARVQNQGRDDEQRYRQAIEEAVAELFGVAAPAPPEKRTVSALEAERRATSDLSLENIALKVTAIGEEQGEIYLDGRSQRRNTPNVIYVQPGTYEVEVRFESGAYGTEKVFLTGGIENQTVAIGPTLVRRGTLRIDTSPSGARILINGEESGTTPLLLEDVAAGLIEIRAEKSGHRSRQQTVKVEPAETAEITIELPEVPTVRIGFGVGIQRYATETTVITEQDGEDDRRSTSDSKFVTQWMLRFVSLHLRDYYLALMADVDIGGLLGGSVGAALTFDLGTAGTSVLAGLALRMQRKVSESSSLGLDSVLGDGNYWFLDVPIEVEYSGIYLLVKPSFVLGTPPAGQSVTGVTTTVVEASGFFTYYLGVGYAFTF